MEYYVYILAALAAVVGAVVLIASLLGFPIWLTLIGIVMVSFGCLVLFADMNRPNGGSPGFKTSAIMVVLFLPVMPIALPLALIIYVGLFVRRKLSNNCLRSH